MRGKGAEAGNPPVKQTDPIVWVVDDDSTMRQSLSYLIESVGLAVRTYGTAKAFLDEFDPTRPGCLVLDVRMPGLSGLELQQELTSRQMNLPIIMMSGHADVPIAVQALKEGAIDFIEKPFSDQLLLDRIRQAIQADIRRHQELVQRSDVVRRIKSLTPREREVMDLVVEGKANKVIAAELGLSPKTVEVHRARLMQKMEVSSVADLVRLAVLYRGQEAR